MYHLRLEQLSKHYNQPLLDEVNLSFTGNGVVALIGDNGSGKSTLLKILSGQEDPDAGKVIWSHSPRIGYLKQEIDTHLDLSGGQKKVALLSELIYSRLYDVLLLDEPDNHLDLENKRWLIDALSDFDGLVIMISHDRYTLKALSKYVWLVEDQSVRTFPFGYEKFVEVYGEEKESQLALYQTQLKEKRRLEAILEVFKARASSGPKAAKTYHAMEKRLARFVSEMVPDPTRNDQAISLSSKIEGKIIKKKTAIFVHDLDFSYPDRTIFDGADLHLFVQDKTALLSPNGTGKTTLIKLLLKQLEPKSGRVEIGPNLSVGYYSQEHNENLPEDGTPMSCFMERYPLFDYQIEEILKKFYFSKQTIRSKIRTLSGGQKARLQLAIFLYSNPDILILDEPTNHLDIKSINALEEFLIQFPGTILLISHDRELVEKVCHDIFIIDRYKIVTAPNNIFIS